MQPYVSIEFDLQGRARFERQITGDKLQAVWPSVLDGKVFRPTIRKNWGARPRITGRLPGGGRDLAICLRAGAAAPRRDVLGRRAP